VISPLLFLALLLVVTAAAATTAAVSRRARSARFARLAAEWQMRFTADDRFQLTPRVAALLPAPGAADVLVRDLVYGQEVGGHLRYFFTVEYTLGVLRTKRRRVSVGTLSETVPDHKTDPAGVTLAPPDLPLQAQYEWLRTHQQPPEAAVR
jgi:hypothetical protein